MAAELRLVDAGPVLAVLRCLTLLGALGGVTPPPRGLLFRFQREEVCPAFGGYEHDGLVARTYQCDWTAASLDLVGERTDRIRVVQWFATHEPSMAQAGRWSIAAHLAEARRASSIRRSAT